MRAPWTQLYVHLVWSTWDRLPMVTSLIRERVYACIQAECATTGSDVIAIGGTETHIHLLVRIPTTLSIATLAKQVKGASSHLVNQVLRPPDAFKWQGAYGAFTVSKAEVPRVREYVLRQAEHHSEGSVDPDWELG